jgi:hypothetical protein
LVYNYSVSYFGPYLFGHNYLTEGFEPLSDQDDGRVKARIKSLGLSNATTQLFLDPMA